jgi:preprotein translocase YajC subunit
MLEATKAAATHSNTSWIFLLYIVVFGGLYFFYIRPRSQRAKAQRAQVRKVEVGERAQTIGGFVGTVVSNDGDLITLRSSSGIELEFVPSAIARRFDPPVPESADDQSEEGDKQ